jgi:ATP-binding cassette, subfamily A (ABC1), member 3
MILNQLTLMARSFPFIVNGAGKTTIMGVLTGDIAPTGGQAYVAGHDITGGTPGGVAAARKNIGFCPQVDPLLDLMSGRETLRMFGRLRGIPEHRLETTVVTLLERLTLTPHADKVAESYSGGNKRKLSLGIALIGDPRVLFIDEASSGMDPSTRRKTWGLIEKAAETRSVVLTSHSMEEVEALCTRVGIMVRGKFLCLGSVQHLKSKYLDGYTVDIHCESGTGDSDVEEVVTTVLTDTLPGSTLAERHGRFMRFDVSSVSSVGLGATFRKLQELKERTSVSNYSFSQCTLEQVFIKLVTSEDRDENHLPESSQIEAPLPSLYPEPEIPSAPVTDYGAISTMQSAGIPIGHADTTSTEGVGPITPPEDTLEPDMNVRDFTPDSPDNP